jgi:NAD(P)-dependent dehydrogenase (short-subunit alcohol dehydrogenase family)
MKAQFDANLFGLVNVTNAFLPHFRSRKSGTIINISSQGGLLNLQGGGIYCASKAAVDCESRSRSPRRMLDSKRLLSCGIAVTEVYSKELAPFNIRITAIALGAFRTAVATNNTKGPEREVCQFSVYALYRSHHQIPTQLLLD